MSNIYQEMMGLQEIDTNVDIVFVIDATESMQPLIDKVKSLTLSFRDLLEDGLKKRGRIIDLLRVKVIVFRDYYVDGEDALVESPFYDLPYETDEFQDFVSSIRAGGGGDEPESGLEALSIALKVPFVQTGSKKRHIIVLFTDASAHPLEQQYEGTPDNYPEDMFTSMKDIYTMWGEGQDYLGRTNGSSNRQMDHSAKRLIFFAPDIYPWNELSHDLRYSKRVEMNKGNGGRDLVLDEVMNLLFNSV